MSNDAAAAFGGRRFDIVYTGIGALCWLPDIAGWARVVAELLRLGGFLYLVEGHPFAQVIDDQDGGSVVSRDYLDDTPQLEACPYTYTDGCAELAHPEQVEFPHTMGEILTALARAGLRLEFVHEHDFELFARFESLHRQPDGTWRFPPGRPRLPMLYSLRASRAPSRRSRRRYFLLTAGPERAHLRGPLFGHGGRAQGRRGAEHPDQNAWRRRQQRLRRPQISAARRAVINSFRSVGNPDHGRASRQPGRMFMHRQRWAWSPASAACSPSWPHVQQGGVPRSGR